MSRQPHSYSAHGKEVAVCEIPYAIANCWMRIFEASVAVVDGSVLNRNELLIRIGVYS